MKNPAAVALGKLGGQAKSARKARAVRENGKKGGRPTNLAIERKERLLALNSHAIYGPLLRKLTLVEHALLLDLIKTYGHLDRDAWTLKIYSLFLDGEKPKHHCEICELLLASR